MSKKTPVISLEEISGDEFSSLAEAQRAALTATVADLAGAIRALLAAGVLVNQNGQITPNPSPSA